MLSQLIKPYIYSVSEYQLLNSQLNNKFSNHIVALLDNQQSNKINLSIHTLLLEKQFRPNFFTLEKDNIKANTY